MKQIFHLLPISEAQLAQQIGISAKTIRRIKQGAPPSKLVRLKIKRYIISLIGKLHTWYADDPLPE